MDKKTLNAVLEDFARALGPYQKTVVIGGGYAPLIYRNYLMSPDRKLPDPAATFDLDILIPRKVHLPKVSGDNLGQRLQKSGFTVERRTLNSPPVESYTKTINDVEVEIEFLTDQKSRQQEAVTSIEGVSAQALSFLEMSLEEAVEFTTDSGAKLQVVVPASWIFHKLLSFERRGNTLKKFIDKSSPEEWEKLIAQDPEGELTKPKFLAFAKKVLDI